MIFELKIGAFCRKPVLMVACRVEAKIGQATHFSGAVAFFNILDTNQVLMIHAYNYI